MFKAARSVSPAALNDQSAVFAEELAAEIMCYISRLQPSPKQQRLCEIYCYNLPFENKNESTLLCSCQCHHLQAIVCCMLGKC